MKIRNYIAASVAVLLLIPFLFSCGEKIEYTDEEVIAAATELIPASYEINEIYFGEGLPTKEVPETEEFVNGLPKEELEDYEYDVQTVKYLPVSEDSPYKSIDEIKAASSMVYSKDYLEILYERAFSGIKDDQSGKVRYAMYIEDALYGLSVRSDIKEKAVSLDRRYDLTTVKVTDKKSDRAKISVESTDPEGKTESVSLTLKKENGKWRLDSPTY